MQEKKFDLIMQLTRVEWLLHKYHQQNHMNFGPMGDPRKGQGRILAMLKMQPEISQKDLSYLLDMRPQSLGELLTKLEKKGYIARTPSETDRRVMNIRLTKEGEEVTESPEQEFSFDKIFECLNDEEQKNLSDYLERMIKTLESQLDDEQPEPDFDPRLREGNPFDERFRGHADWTGGREDHRPGQFDPRLNMGRNFPDNRPFGQRSTRFDPRQNTGRGYGEGPVRPDNKPDEE